MKNILDNIINKKEKEILLTGTVSNLSPLEVKLYPGDDAIKVKCVTSLLGLIVGSNVLIAKYYSKFIIIGVIGSPTDIESDVSDITPSWQSWVPKLTWTGTPPSNITGLYEYCKVGTLVHFAIDMNSSDGNGATNLTISLPVNGQGSHNIHYMFTCTQLVGSSWNDSLVSFFNVPAGTNVIEFRNFDTLTDNTQWYLFLSGFYESAS